MLISFSIDQVFPAGQKRERKRAKRERHERSSVGSLCNRHIYLCRRRARHYRSKTIHGGLEPMRNSAVRNYTRRHARNDFLLFIVILIKSDASNSVLLGFPLLCHGPGRRLKFISKRAPLHSHRNKLTFSTPVYLTREN